MHYASYYFAKDPGCYGPDGMGDDLSKCTIVTKSGRFIEPNSNLTANDIRVINALYPERNSTNYELEELEATLQADHSSVLSKFEGCRCVLEGDWASLKRKDPNRAFGDNNARRDQYNKVVNKKFDPNRDVSKAESNDSKAVRKTCPYTVKKYCRHAFDAAKCVLGTERTMRRKYPGKAFGDNTKCRRLLDVLKKR